MKILIAGGGTAGHINPALAIANTIKSKNKGSQILFVGNHGSLEHKLVEKAGFEIAFVQVEGLRRKLSCKNVKMVCLLLKAINKSREIIKKFNPDIVIGTGGYVSAPVLYAAHKENVKCCIHEQNAYPGITSKILSRYADIVFISFEDSKKYFPRAKKIVLTGNPLRREFLISDTKLARQKLQLDDEDFFVLSFAGSLGAREVNKVMAQIIIKNHNEKQFCHTHATGSYGYKWMPELLLSNGFDIRDGQKNGKIKVLEYIYDMPLQLAACDLVVSRAGAITLGEIMSQGKASILIPSPNVTHNHQYYNAMALSQKKAAVVITEDQMTCRRIYDQIIKLRDDPEERKAMGERARDMALLNASESMYREIYSLVKDRSS